jgi:hypothetical protein
MVSDSSYNLELVPARLLPFDWSSIGGNSVGQGIAQPTINNAIYGFQNDPGGQTLTADQQSLAQALASANGLSIGYSIQSRSNYSLNGLSTTGSTIYPPSHPLYPLTLTNGLVFPYNPTISEALGIKYDTVELIHTNESVNAYKGTDNVRISLSDCVWTAETFDMAVYTLGVIHFLRSYSLMDFGRRSGTGRPPSPMWFYAYGQYLYYQVPVLIERVEFSLPIDVDYVGVPNPGTDAYNNQTLQYSTTQALNSFLNQTGQYTWIPMKFTVGSITMVVQHSIAYWTQTFSLDDFKAGNLIGRS